MIAGLVLVGNSADAVAFGTVRTRHDEVSAKFATSNARHGSEGVVAKAAATSTTSAPHGQRNEHMERDGSPACQEVRELDLARARALVDVDLALLEAITAEDYTHVESSGAFSSKAEFLAELATGVFRFESFVIDENHLRCFGDLAVVTGRYHNDVVARGRLLPTKYARHLRVYARRGGVWLNVAHQATEAATPPPSEVR